MRWVMVLVAAQWLQMAATARILALCTVGSRSHSLWCYKYMAMLAERGHQITVLGVDKPTFKVPNMTTYIAEGVFEAIYAQEHFQVYEATSKSVIHTLISMDLWHKLTAEVILHSKAMKDLIHKHKGIQKPFDLIIHDDGNCAGAILGLLPLFGNPPLVLATTYGSPQWMAVRVGNVFNPAYVPNMLINFKPNMSFYERLLNTYYYVVTELFTRYSFEWHQENLKREVFGEGLPHVRDLAKRANVVFLNYNPVIDYPRPLLPGVIGVAGVHIDDPKPLPKDIKDFMDGAKHGVVLFSLGTYIGHGWVGEDFESEVIKAFVQIPQRVLWKWHRTPPNLPFNVRVAKWLPQADIMAHPNIRLFASHCGLLSTQEAIFRKVPILSLPYWLDQVDNAALLVRRNMSVQIDIRNLKAAQLRDGIREMINNPVYKENTARLGSLVQDMPMTAKQQAVYWTEYKENTARLGSLVQDMPMTAKQQAVYWTEYKENTARLGSLVQDMPMTAKQQAVYWTEYKENTARLGSLVQDMPMTAKQQAVYWTEYKENTARLGSLVQDMPMTAKQQAVYWTEYKENTARLGSLVQDMPMTAKQQAVYWTEYKENTARLGSLVQDMPMTAKQQAVYWTEYVLRHHGATHLRSAAADLPWYQLILLDVITLVVTVTLVTLWLIKTVFVFVLRKVCIKTKKKAE